MEPEKEEEICVSVKTKNTCDIKSRSSKNRHVLKKLTNKKSLRNQNLRFKRLKFNNAPLLQSNKKIKLLQNESFSCNFIDIIEIIRDEIWTFLQIRDINRLAISCHSAFNIFDNTLWRAVYIRDVAESLKKNGFQPRAVLQQIKQRNQNYSLTIISWLIPSAFKLYSGGLPNVSDYKLLLLDEFIIIQEEKLKVLEERCLLLSEMAKFRKELLQLLENCDSPQVKIQLQQLLDSRPDREEEVAEINRKIRPRIAQTLAILRQSMTASLRRSTL